MEIIHLNTITPENLEIKQNINQLLNSALQSADPYRSVSDPIHVHDNLFTFKPDNKSWDISNGIVLIAFGKASMPMSQAVVDAVGNGINNGICVTKLINSRIKLPEKIKVCTGGHPNPNQASILAATWIKDAIQQADQRSFILCLISGGGSALVTQPTQGISLEDLRTLNQLMLSEHLSIEEINTVRKHCDDFKGGGLVRWAEGRKGLSLIISDVLSGELDMVASGPTLPDPTTFEDAIDILKQSKLVAKAPKSIIDHLIAGAAGRIADTLKLREYALSNFTNLEVGSIRQSIDEVTRMGQDLGWLVIKQNQYLSGDMEEIARKIENDIMATERKEQTQLLIYGSEGSVKIKGKGLGGRNTHLALLLTPRIQGMDGITILTFATDGEDGNSPAAGAVIDGKTYTRAVQKGMDVEYYLRNSNSYQFFYELQDAIVTGSTGTNVNDLILVIIDKEQR